MADWANLPGHVVAVIEKAPGDGYRKRGGESLVVDVAGVVTGEASQLLARVLEVCEVGVVGRAGKPGDFDGNDLFSNFYYFGPYCFDCSHS